MCHVVLLQDSPSLSLQLFNPLFLLLGSLQVPLLQQSASETQTHSLCKQEQTLSINLHSCLLVLYQHSKITYLCMNKKTNYSEYWSAGSSVIFYFDGKVASASSFCGALWQQGTLHRLTNFKKCELKLEGESIWSYLLFLTWIFMRLFLCYFDHKVG